ncbi:MAG: ShlB/FhaC/HecB family hemolysin secretion/activation protein [Aquabacterium sp.]|uniref:ShlB/FhaC/HecB family hemolysin secretion/activation protein n=1 Tax=Aquabacterium sp. TaxID=1872578 RepID=UPI00271D48B0|nr:ShlB/FhaC/HecB family hemolysin secretion/activation protein [Aquabacterium sp.]MDO9002422.1 ShlB/FhaC/HecB family hemolysin secretion/activation protein [Aquabacterium sp.]
MMMNRAPTLLAITLALALPAHAQQPPDAGQTLQQLQPDLPAPRTSQGVDIQAPNPTATPAGGMEIRLQTVSFEGNTLFSDAALQAVLGDVTGKTFDMAGLRQLAEAVNRHYRREGYPFARAFLPTQALNHGALRIEVIEGRYGEVRAIGDDAPLVAQAQAFLAPLQSGAVIESRPLERASLVLSDQPGIQASPVLRPGQAVGSGDLEVAIQRTKAYTVEIGLDNHGNRYTGQAQARLNLDINSPFRLGDQATLHSLITQQGMWFGQLGYSLPLGASGLRGQVGYAHTYYELGQEFDALGANGTAHVASLGMSYPLLRSQGANLSVSGTYQHKILVDKQDAVGTRSDKFSHSLPLALNFDVRDGFGGGGITQGALAWTQGQLHLDASLRNADALTARMEGHFGKLNLDLVRSQALMNRLTLFARVSAQWTHHNLDSSEEFGLGGPGGVRAYPVGEGYGDRGWLGQLELRYTLDAWAPYAFYDSGKVTTAARPWTPGINERHVAGAGVGLRYQQGGWRADASIAWRSQGGAAQSDTVQRNPTGWLTVSHQF